MNEVQELLDHLDAARAKATPGPWQVDRLDSSWSRVRGTPPGWEHIAVTGQIAGSDAACIVAEHNAVPRLTAALRAVLALADEMSSDRHGTPGQAYLYAANRIRAALTAPLAGHHTADEGARQ